MLNERGVDASFGIRRFANNSVKAKDALQYVMGKLRDAGKLFGSKPVASPPATLSTPSEVL